MTPAPASRPQNMLGIGYMAMAVAAGVVTSIIVKTLSVEFAVLVVLSMRFLFSIPPLAIAAWFVRGREMFAIQRWERLLIRIVVGHVGIVFWFLGIAHTGLGQATALFQSSAIFVTILSPIVLKERVGLYRGGAVMAGLFGIYLVTNPLSDGFNIGSAYGVASAIAGALLVLVLRLLGRTEEPVSVAIWHNLVGAVVYPAAALAAAMAAPMGWVLTEHLPLLVVLGIGAAFVQIGFTAAYRYGEAAVLVPVRYLSVPVAGILGWLIWDELLSGGEITGMAIVVLSCAFISCREYWLNRGNRTTLSDHLAEHRQH